MVPWSIFKILINYFSDPCLYVTKHQDNTVSHKHISNLRTMKVHLIWSYRSVIVELINSKTDAAHSWRYITQLLIWVFCIFISSKFQARFEKSTIIIKIDETDLIRTRFWCIWKRGSVVSFENVRWVTQSQRSVTHLTHSDTGDADCVTLSLGYRIRTHHLLMDGEIA